jgi:exosortase A-associated hydrolase 2
LSTSSETELDPFFLNGAHGRVFCLFLGPPPNVRRRGAVLLVPPFAEEMNKARRQMTGQARALAEAGFEVLSTDLYGTGDSEGDFADGRWEGWIQDLMSAAGWLRTRGAASLTILGLRLGSLLAADLALRLPQPPDHVVLWQPVTSGKQHIDQFLRLRVASAALGGGGGVTVRSLRDSLVRGQPVEVAGYELHPDAVRQIDDRDLMKSVPDSAVRVAWFELVHDEKRGISPASERVVAAWRERSLDVVTEVVVGEPFWSTVEVVVAPALIERTTRWISENA